MEVKFKIDKDIINTIIDKMAEIESNDLRIKQLVCNSKDIDKIIKERNQYKKEMNKNQKGKSIFEFGRRAGTNWAGLAELRERRGPSDCWTPHVSDTV